MEKILLAFLLLLSMFVFALMLNCGGGGSDDNSSTRGGLDDDDDDDSVNGGDDDEYTESAPPVLSNAYFTPDPAETNEEGVGVTHLNIDVCDVNNDLMPDGRLTLSSVLGTTAFPWDDPELLPGGDLNDVDDCANPVSIGMVVELAININWELCIEAEATDNAGNVSDKLTDICVQFLRPD